MGRIFGIIAVVSISLMIVVGGGVFWLTSIDVERSKHESVMAVLNNLAVSLSQQLEFMQLNIDGVAQAPDVVAALSSGNPAVIKATAERLQSTIPHILKLRLLLPNVSDVDESAVPHMGFGDLDMIRATLNGQAVPLIQGQAEHRHLALTSAVRKDDKIIGVVLASLDADLFKDILLRNRFESGVIALKQDRLVLARIGSAEDDGESISLPVSNSRWVIESSVDFNISLGDFSLLAGVFVVPVIILCLVLFEVYRKFTGYFREDQNSLLKAAKDILQGKRVGNYPMRVAEMQPIISAMVQFNRVIAEEHLVPANLSEELDGSFFDAPDKEAPAVPDDLEQIPVPQFRNIPINGGGDSLFKSSSREAIVENNDSAILSPLKKKPDSYDVNEDVEWTPELDAVLTAVKPKNEVESPKARSKKTEEQPVSDSWDMDADNLSVPDWNMEKEESTAPDSWDMDAGSLAKSRKPKSAPTITKAPGIDLRPPADPGIFHEHDICGVVGKELNEDMMVCIGRAFASEAKQLNVQTIVVARDGRLSSPVLVEALISGIVSTGCDVLDLGLVPLPVLCFVAHHSDGRSGVMLTGGDLAGNYSGLKMLLQGQPLTKKQIQGLRARIENGSYSLDQIGSVEQNNVFRNEYVGIITEDLRVSRPMTVVVDCGNGATGTLAPELLRALGCDVIELNCDIDGLFPEHGPDPVDPANLQALINAVTLNGADLGVAFDSDGSRMGLVDSAGRIIWPDRQMMLFARDVLANKAGAEIIFDAASSKHLGELIKKRGGHPVLWNGGRIVLQNHMHEIGAAMAGDMEGHFLFRDRWFGFSDALYAAARMIAIVSADSRSSSQLFDDLPSSPCTPEIRVPMAENEVSDFIKQLFGQAKFNNVYAIKPDGMRAEFSDGWGVVRAAAGKPALLIRFEADSEDAMARIQTDFRSLMLNIRPDLLLPF